MKGFGLAFNLINLLPIIPLDGGKIAGAVSPYLGVLGVLGGGAALHMSVGIIDDPISYLILATGAVFSTRRLMGWDKDDYTSSSTSTTSDRKEGDGRQDGTEGHQGSNSEGKSSSERFHDIGGDRKASVVILYGTLIGALLIALKWNGCRKLVLERKQLQTRFSVLLLLFDELQASLILLSEELKAGDLDAREKFLTRLSLSELLIEEFKLGEFNASKIEVLIRKLNEELKKETEESIKNSKKR